jgi:hypothetical protein
MVLMLMGLAFVVLVSMTLAFPVEAMRPGFHLFGKVMHSHRTQMFNCSHHVAHSLINGAMAALGIFAMLRHGPFQVLQHAFGLLVMAGLAKFMDATLLLLGPLLQLILPMCSIIALTLTFGVRTLPFAVVFTAWSLSVTIAFGVWPFPVTFTAWPFAFLLVSVTFGAWFITLDFALRAILIPFVLVVRIRRLVGK